MKKLFMLLLFLGLVTNCFAGVTAKVLGVTVKDRDYIWIEIEYDIDGRKVVNSYPMDFQNVVGKTPQEVLGWIRVNVEYQCDRYIEAEFRKKVNAEIIKDKLSTLVNKTYTKNNATIMFDVDNDQISDYQWTIETTGNYTEQIIP